MKNDFREDSDVALKHRGSNSRDLEASSGEDERELECCVRFWDHLARFERSKKKKASTKSGKFHRVKVANLGVGVANIKKNHG